MKILYYECSAGISGDMNLGALLDLGIEEEYLRSELLKVNLSGYTLSTAREKSYGIEGTRCIVDLTKKREPHHHTHFREIREMIDKSALSADVKDLALSVFTEIAEAEAKIHGKSVDSVAFHEVGAVDSIVDIVGAAICISALNPDRIISTPPELGSGFVKCAHGTLPVPVPAVLEILQGVPVTSGNFSCETTTPTGAAFLKAAVSEFRNRIAFTPLRTGYGLGTRKLPVPNVLRVTMGEMEPQEEELTGRSS